LGITHPKSLHVFANSSEVCVIYFVIYQNHSVLKSLLSLRIYLSFLSCSMVTEIPNMMVGAISTFAMTNVLYFNLSEVFFLLCILFLHIKECHLWLLEDLVDCSDALAAACIDCIVWLSGFLY